MVMILHRLTPGIRLESDDIHDQTRVTTLTYGKSESSDYLVLDRSITEIDDMTRTQFTKKCK